MKYYLILIGMVLSVRNAQATMLSTRAFELAQHYNISSLIISQAVLTQDSLDQQENNNSFKLSKVLICGGFTLAVGFTGGGLECFDFSGKKFLVGMTGFAGFGVSIDAGIAILNSTFPYKKGFEYFFKGEKFSFAWGLAGGTVTAQKEVINFPGFLDNNLDSYIRTGGWAAAVFYSGGYKAQIEFSELVFTAK